MPRCDREKKNNDRAGPYQLPSDNARDATGNDNRASRPGNDSNCGSSGSGGQMTFLSTADRVVVENSQGTFFGHTLIHTKKMEDLADAGEFVRRAAGVRSVVAEIYTPITGIRVNHARGNLQTRRLSSAPCIPLAERLAEPVVPKCAHCSGLGHIVADCPRAPEGTIKACPMCPNNKSHVADKYATFFQASIEEKVRVLVFERGSMPAYETQKSWYSYLLEYMELSDSQPIPERFPWTRAFAKVRSRTIVPLQRAFNRNRDRSQLPSDDATRDWAAVVALHAWAGTHIHRDDPTTLRRGRAEKSEEANATSETLAIESPEDTKEEVRRLRQRLSVVEDQLAALQTQVRDLQGPEPSQAPGLWQNPRKRFAKGPTLWEKPEKQARRE
ncbi:hypothetical protein BGZ61DRAFT_587180 [Ilyonectria robusta]|uniref:uncharacterized protein n=1 Tax=Ilyonectria robusta TaxID=1079257 RepID=UPI001E8CD398|nr:uncharacterized protein BGZ61DRAFT_587180 [Ilyonectria robusta]KAH8714410.1 hypothetical protein BGZ61DRAFT_587180 [Ilyonectria robusta]